jgi:hypothetical protein
MIQLLNTHKGTHMTKEEQKQHVLDLIRTKKKEILRANTYVECNGCGGIHNTCDVRDMDYYVLKNNATIITFVCPTMGTDEVHHSTAYDLVPPPKVDKAIWA